MKASDLFMKALENEGVEYIFGIPGEENLDFLDSMRNSKIRLILTRHEQGAGFMAATLGRLTGKPGVCLSTLGPGATNFTTPAAFAQLGAMPMLMITGQKPIKKSKQGRFQIVYIVDLFRPLTKYTRQIVNGNNIPSMVREAFRLAMQERPGAVTFEIFGPVVCVYSYSDREKAIEIANSLDVHFQASVFTKHLDMALDCVKKLNATAVMVNDHTAFRVDWMPFGGRDASGIGMGGIQYSMHEMTREKLIVMKSKTSG